MGGSGSRLSKELLAEYQVRETRSPGSLRAACARERTVPVPRPGGWARPLAPGGLLTLLSRFAFQDLTFLTKQEILL